MSVINYVRMRNTKHEFEERYVWILDSWEDHDWTDLANRIRDFLSTYAAGNPSVCAFNALPPPLHWVPVVGHARIVSLNGFKRTTEVTMKGAALAVHQLRTVNQLRRGA